jgi:hypothetical protein
MARRMALVVAGAFAVSLLMVGAGQAVCDPYCSPKSNEKGPNQLKGQDRANWVHNYKNGGGTAGGGTGGGGTGGDPGTTPPPVDTDGDGLPDTVDQCPTVFAQTSNGCLPQEGG